MSQSLVSVIVPFYNSERYLGEAIQSVLAQDYRPFEVLLVDDGSTDGGADIASSFASTLPEIRFLRLPENRGPAAARNHGLAQAAGGLLTFLDADDAMLPDRLTYQAGHLARHPDVDVVLGAEELIVEPDAPPASFRQRHLRGPGPRFHTMSMMARREAWHRVGGFDPSYRLAEDLDWLFRAAAGGLVVAKVDRILTRHRLHRDNLSHRIDEGKSAIIRSLRARLLERRRDGSWFGQRHHPVP